MPRPLLVDLEDRSQPMQVAGFEITTLASTTQTGNYEVFHQVGPAGSPRDVLEIKVTFSFPSRRISAIDVPLRRLGPGHYYSPGFDVPLAGAWRVEATPQLSEFEEPTLAGQIKFG